MKKIIAANWKMSGSKYFIKKYFNYFEKNIKNTSRNNIIILELKYGTNHDHIAHKITNELIFRPTKISKYAYEIKKIFI